jgi:hypothetical protein
MNNYLELVAIRTRKRGNRPDNIDLMGRRTVRSKEAEYSSAIGMWRRTARATNMSTSSSQGLSRHDEVISCGMVTSRASGGRRRRAAYHPDRRRLSVGSEPLREGVPGRINCLLRTRRGGRGKPPISERVPLDRPAGTAWEALPDRLGTGTRQWRRFDRWAAQQRFDPVLAAGRRPPWAQNFITPSFQYSNTGRGRRAALGAYTTERSAPAGHSPCHHNRGSGRPAIKLRPAVAINFPESTPSIISAQPGLGVE